MGYSINIIMHPYADKKGLHKINIQVIVSKMKAYSATDYKIPASNFDKGAIIKHPLKVQYNLAIKETCHEIEKRLIEFLHTKQVMTKIRLEEIVKNKQDKQTGVISDFVYELIDSSKGKLSVGRLKQYKVMAGKIEYFQKGATFGALSVDWLNKFETWLRNKGLDGNTILSNMSMIIAFANRANEAGLLKPEQFKGYKRPKRNQKIPEYLTEEEIDRVFTLVKVIEKPGHKLAGYYFILSCLTGYRISDSKRFDYENMVKGDKIILRAKKNKNIVTIPIYPKLKEVIDFVKDKPLTLSEQKVREYVKEICSLAGIKKDVKFHASRHSFAMMLIGRGFSIDEVSSLLGDTPQIGRIYARITNTHIEKKFNELLP